MPRPVLVGRSLWTVLAIATAACSGESAPTPPDSDPVRLTAPGMHVRTLDVDGVPRRYRVYLPTTVDPDRPSPVVAMLHGFPPIDMAPVTRLNEEAETRGIIAVYPESAWEEDWVQACNCTPNGLRGIDDLRYFAALLDDLAGAVAVDPARRYVAGFSNGGMMAYRLACERADLFAGYAAVGALMWRWHMEACPNGPPVPLLMILGTQDPSFPWEGSTVQLITGAFVDQLSANDHAAWWSSRNGCAGPAAETPLPDRSDDGTRAHLQRWKGCATPTEVIRIDGGGHTWPGTSAVFHPSLGRRSDDLDATSRILDFFLGA